MNRMLLGAAPLFLVFQLFGQSRPLSDSARLMTNEAVRTYGQSKWDSALYYAMIAERLTAKEAGEISDQHGMALFLIAEAYRTKENTSAAREFFKKSTAVFAQTGLTKFNAQTYSFALVRAGFVCANLGATEEAQEYFSKAISLNNTLHQPAENLQIYLWYAGTLMDKGDYAKADSIHAEIQAVLNTLHQTEFTHYLQASLYNNIGKWYTETGNPLKALHYLRKAAETEKMAMDEGYADNDYVQVCLNLCETYAINGKMDSAWAACRQAEKGLTINNWALHNAQIAKTKARLYQQQKQYDKAIYYDSLFININSFLPVKTDSYYATLVNLGILYINTRQHHRADSLFRQIIQQQRQTGIRYSFVMQQALAGLSANLIDLNHYAEATDSLLSLIQLSYAALRENFAGMSEAGKLKYRTLLDSYFDLLYTCLYQNKPTDPKKMTAILEAELQRKNLVLTNQARFLSRARQIQDTAFQQLFNAWLSSRQILSKQYSLPFSQRSFNLDSLERATEMLEKKIAQKGFRPYFENNRFLLPGATIKHQTGVANIEFVQFHYTRLDSSNVRYAAFVYKAGDSTPAFVQLCSEEALLGLMKDSKGRVLSNEELTRNFYDASAKTAGLLYQRIWQPLTAFIKNCTVLNYSPAGLLNNIAFPALCSGKGMLINAYSLHCFSSLLAADDSDQNMALPKTISLWGNMNYDKAGYSFIEATKNPQARKATPEKNDFYLSTTKQTKGNSAPSFLSFQTEEIAGLKKLFANRRVRVSNFENGEATEEAFKQQASAAGDVLHISTHGFYLPLDKKQHNQLLPGSFIAASVNPLFRCGLAFSGANRYWSKGLSAKGHEDGILTGFEVAQLDLHNTKLVTLSACETGLGDVTEYEGNQGMQRAFKLAGVRNLLVSLWRVPAKQTAALFSLFYANWLAGDSLSEALHKAQRTLQQKYPPYFWAGFVLIE